MLWPTRVLLGRHAVIEMAAVLRINRLLCERAARERYATLFWSYFDPQAELLRYINAGHFPPLLFRANRREMVRLTEGGPVLGLLADAAYRQGSISLEPGDVLVLYSDGIVEASNPQPDSLRRAGLLRTYRAGG